MFPARNRLIINLCNSVLSREGWKDTAGQGSLFVSVMRLLLLANLARGYVQADLDSTFMFSQLGERSQVGHFVNPTGDRSSVAETLRRSGFRVFTPWNDGYSNM